MTFNIYCDESCHLEHDGINVMVLGAIWCPKEKLKNINERIKEIKHRNGVYATSELKWVKVSPVKERLYKDLINYFFGEDDLHFRCLIIPDKSKLDHKRFNQTHDEWYYKMYFDLLKVIFNPRDNYEVYLDIKDTKSYKKTQELYKVCCNSIYDFSGEIIKRIQPIRSNEVQIMQIVDVLIGAVAYHNRYFSDDFKKSETKLELVNMIKKLSGYSLTKSTLYKEEKFNIFVWDAR